MPDWTIHIGGADLVGRPWWKENLRFFLLGAILPDVFARIEAVFVDFFGLDIFDHYNMDAFHTPLMIIFIAALIALYTSRPKAGFGLLFSGSMLHFFMDMLEQKVSGFGTPMLYPFSYKTFQLGLVHLYGPAMYLGWSLFFLILLYAVWEKKEQDIICLSRTKKRLWAFILTGIILVIPYVSHFLYEKHNVGFTQFFDDPAAFEGKPVNIYSALVINENPLIIREQFKEFTLVTDRHFKKGSWISLEGVYRNGKFYPSYIQNDQGVFSKSLLSIPVLLLFPFLWWDRRKIIKIFDWEYSKAMLIQFWDNLQTRGIDEEEG